MARLSPENGLEEVNGDFLEADFWPDSAASLAEEVTIPGRVPPILVECCASLGGTMDNGAQIRAIEEEIRALKDALRMTDGYKRD